MIHNLVVDEWDVGGTQEFTGSYVSDFMSGSATPSAGSWSRQRFGDTTNFDPNGVFNNSIYRSENLTRYYERMQFNRNAQMSCPDEQFYDSMIPRMDELFRIEGSKSPYNAAVGLGSMLITFDYQDYFTDGFAVIDWTRSFPFEPKYSSLTRTSYIDKVYSQYNVIFFALIGAPAPRPALLGVDENIALETYHPSNPGTGLNVVGEYKSGLFTGLKYTDVIKHMYGSGDWNNVRRGLPTFEDTNSYVGSTCRPYYRAYSPGTSGGAPNYGYSGVLLGALIRGWKYGLMNGTELHSKAVYRRDRYGQLRDMLEQRLDAKFHDGHTALASPVRVQFIGPKGTTISPENTFSSNLSFEASSSLPYFDGIVRNREEPIYIPSIYSMRFTK
jgi:hypothetical protein